MKNFSVLRFLRRESGVATIETVLWFPLLIMIFGLMLDAALVFHGQAKVLRVVQDHNREYSVGRYATTAETETAIETELAALKLWPDDTTTVVIAGVARTQVRVPAAQLTMLGYFSGLENMKISVSANHMIENWEL